VDLVTATFDVFSHLHSAMLARAFLRGAARSLRPGGTLLFDAITPHDIDRNWVDYVHYLRRDRWKLVRFGRRVAPGVGELHYEWFVRGHNGRWRHQKECHRLRAWPRAQVQSWLQSSGFTHIRCMDAGTLRAPGRACVRWLFTARR
jgi:SAM-dependent methyltransferase